MHIVYILKSIAEPDKIYIGITSDLNKRLNEHNSERVGYSKRHAPWGVETYTAFKNKMLAESFEKYLKAGSGQAFLGRPFRYVDEIIY